MTKVVIIESEQGWGQRIEEVKEFPTEEEAKVFCEKFNACNTEPVAPAWYMKAEIVK